MTLSNTQNPPVVGARLDTMHAELSQLMGKYGNYLKEESIQGDVECLTAWIEAYQQGSQEAASYLDEYGVTLLEHIRTQLEAAANDLQRLDGESPAAKSFSGRDAHHLSRAAALASDAGKELEVAIEEEMK